MNRRDFSRFACACATGAVPLLAGAQSLAPKLAPGFRPDKGSDEMGLWDMVDREEARIRKSRFVLHDPAIEKYLSEVVCKVTGDYCPDLRIYLVRTPYFNASMMPNGMMALWTGTLLRVSNEAQLAAVIGHEAGHYLRRHTVDRFRDAQDKTALSLVLSMGLAVAGLGVVSNLTGLAIAASAMSYGRDQEREADAVGLDLMQRAGYDPVESANVWSQLIAENKARESPSPRDFLFASHPGEEEREASLRERASTMAGASDGSRQGRDRYRAAIAPLRPMLFADEIRLRQYGPTLALFSRMLEHDPDDAELIYYTGEVYRLRARDGDDTTAIGYLERALATGKAPPEAWRSLGLVRRSRGETDAARDAFRRYLALHPDADDALMIQSYLGADT
jgi:predicted Zn-dependent protease